MLCLPMIHLTMPWVQVLEGIAAISRVIVREKTLEEVIMARALQTTQSWYWRAQKINSFIALQNEMLVDRLSFSCRGSRKIELTLHNKLAHFFSETLM